MQVIGWFMNIKVADSWFNILVWVQNQKGKVWKLNHQRESNVFK